MGFPLVDKGIPPESTCGFFHSWVVGFHCISLVGCGFPLVGQWASIGFHQWVPIRFPLVGGGILLADKVGEKNDQNMIAMLRRMVKMRNGVIKIMKLITNDYKKDDNDDQKDDKGYQKDDKHDERILS